MQTNIESTSVISLDGQWLLAHDSSNIGKQQEWWTTPRPDAKSAQVPWIAQDPFPGIHGVFWYWREFTAPANPHVDGRYLLRFHAVDYLAEVWVNGIHIGGHEGSETPFILDATAAIKPNDMNQIAVRVLNPNNDRIDEITLAETPHRNKVTPFGSGCSYNVGGILESVELLIAPAVRIEDLHVVPDVKTGNIKIITTIFNAGSENIDGEIQFTVAPAITGETIAATVIQQKISVGQSVIETQVTVDKPRLWDLEHPYLYRVTAGVKSSNTQSSQSIDEHSIRCGFRDFRVEKGFFRLNGKRVFLRSTHTGNHSPGGQVISPKSKDVLIHDLIIAKNLGFNTVRFISGVPHPYQLDFCDEIGLMVYEESYAGWCLADSPDMSRRFDFSTREMIIRDRNHPSVTIWGLLNETVDSPTYVKAKESLPLVRELDNTRLVLLSSGRWDCDPIVGSVSNPGSNVWEHVWGIESPDATKQVMTNIGGYTSNAGDAHVYPGVPQTQEINSFIRNLGKDAKPVFLSEYGIGSQINAIRELRKYEEAGLNLEADDAAYLRNMSDKFIADWNRLGFENTYPVPEDMLLDSQRLMARWRTLGFNLIRSNPQICGFNLTGMLDHAITGEGLWTFWREFKPGIADSVSDGWAPLRWCVFVNPTHGYSGEEFEIEAVLANEDVLKPGDYPVCFKITGPTGTVWECKSILNIPEPPAGDETPLASSALKECIKLDVPAGVYEFTAYMEHGGAPTGGRLKFHISDRKALPKVDCPITLWGVDKYIEDWLASQGISCNQFTESSANSCEVILVGDSAELRGNLDGWINLVSRIAQGSVVIFSSPDAFMRTRGFTDESAEQIDLLGWLPLANKGELRTFGDWLYHKESVAKLHPVFNEMQCKGIMDWDYYEQVSSNKFYTGQDTPDDVAAAAFALGHSGAPGGYDCGVMLCSYPFKAGRFILNTFSVLEHVGKHPAAEKLLLNMINYANGLRSEQQSALPEDFDELLDSIGYK